jgi:hypothetical protein
MRARTRWIGFGAVMVLGIAAVGTWRYVAHLNHRPETQIHNTAVADAAKKVDDVLDRFAYDHLYKADDYAHTAGQNPDVQVLSVAGQTHWQTGVTLVLKVTGHGVVIGADGSVIRERNSPICFRLQLGPDDDSRDDDIGCPAGKPLSIPQDPSLDGVDDRLQGALDSVRPSESAVRAAVAGLNLDPAIRQDVVAQDGIVGVALRATQYDCIVARVASGGARLWRPSHTQLAPGELDCSAGIALSSQFGKYPH